MDRVEVAIGQTLRALGDALVGDPVERDLHAVFEREVQRVAGVRSARLREFPSRYHARLVTPTRTSQSIVLGVPSADPRVQAVLEASFDPASPPGDEQLDVLAAASQLGGLVLESCRMRLSGMARPIDAAAPLIGSSSIMQMLRGRVERVALTDFTVLVEGESGTGKELVARQIHEVSRRRNGPFVAVNCAALVETLLEAELFGIEERTATGVRGRQGKFEHAEGGTLFLDEISDLSLSAQAKLLRAIQDVAVERVGGHGARRVNTRIVAATNRSLADMVARGLFRSDLYYRLGGVEIHVPPLRARREDVCELATYFLARHSRTRDLGLSDAAADALRTYEWPGNVRELERFIERAVALTDSDDIELDDLPPQFRGDSAEVLGPSLAAGESMRAWGSRYARLMFERCGRNKRRTCRHLDISYHTLEAYLRYSRRDSDAPGQLPAWARPARARTPVQSANTVHERREQP
jgi:transcriptional regulator with PAS, ATPase and Fis domain